MAVSVFLSAMCKTCPQCNVQRDWHAFRLESDRCPKCGYSPSLARLAKLAALLRRLILAAYPIAISLLYLFVIAIPAWILIDACFHPALVWARVDLGVPDEQGRLLSLMPQVSLKVHQWSMLGVRIWSLIILSFAIPLCLVISLVRIILAAPRRRHLTAALVALTALAAIIHQYDNFLCASVRRRVAHQLPRFQAAVKPLLIQWPLKPGELPEAGEFMAYEQRPREVHLRRSGGYGLKESFGMFVNQLPDGGVQFSLEPHYLFLVEYHPPRGRPAAQLEWEYWVDMLTRADELADGWYLTRYSSVRK